MTEEIFRDDSYAASCSATVTAAEAGGVVLDRSVFYPMGGGQPGDRGRLTLADGRVVEVVDTVKHPDSGAPLHVLAEGATLPAVGEAVEAAVDWQRRHRLMRMHSALHLVCAVVEGGVTGGSVGEDRGRLDFDLPDTSLDKAAIEAALNRLVEEDHAVAYRWISDDEMAAQPDLVRTMSVKPPSGQGRVRLVEIDGVDLQPCGGTHVRSTAEIGALRVGKIENKGRHNRRINIHFA